MAANAEQRSILRQLGRVRVTTAPKVSAPDLNRKQRRALVKMAEHGTVYKKGGGTSHGK